MIMFRVDCVFVGVPRIKCHLVPDSSVARAGDLFV
jgi:hypothetical protein